VISLSASVPYPSSGKPNSRSDQSIFGCNWLSQLIQIFTSRAPYWTPAHFGRAQVLEKLGRPRDDREAYERLFEFGQDLDPELYPMVQKVRQRREVLPKKKAAE